MTATPITDFERRVSQRVPIDGQIKYKLENETRFHTGMMIDISQSGVLISLNQPLTVNTRLSLLMESDNSGEPAIEICAVIIRIAEHASDYAYSYGCMILDVND